MRLSVSRIDLLLPPSATDEPCLTPVPIIASVSEHQPTAWPSFFFDLQMMIFIFPAGIFLCFQKLTDGHVFVIIYAVLASYFAGVMVRLVRLSSTRSSAL